MISVASRRLLEVVRKPEVRVVLLLGLLATTASFFALLSARWLGPHDRGAVVIFTTTSSFLLLLGSLGVGTGARVLLHASPPLGLAAYAKYARRLTLGHVLTTATLGLSILSLTGGFPHIHSAFIFVFYAVIQLRAFFYREGLHGLGKHHVAVIGEMIASIIGIVGLVLLQQFDSVSLNGVYYAILLGSSVQLLFFHWHTRRADQGCRDYPLGIGSLVRFSLPAMMSNLCEAFVVRGDRLILGITAGSTAVGIYGAAATFTEVLWLLPAGVAQVAFRRTSARGDPRISRHARKIALILTVIACACLGLAAAPLINILLGPEYAAALPLMYVLIAASLPMASYQIDVAVIKGAGRLKMAGAISSAGVAALLVGCAALVPLLGSMGAAIASLFSYSIIALLARVAVRKTASTAAKTRRGGKDG